VCVRPGDVVFPPGLLLVGVYVSVQGGQNGLKLKLTMRVQFETEEEHSNNRENGGQGSGWNEEDQWVHQALFH